MGFELVYPARTRRPAVTSAAEASNATYATVSRCGVTHFFQTA